MSNGVKYIFIYAFRIFLQRIHQTFDNFICARMREAILAKLSCPLPALLSSAVATLVGPRVGATLRHDDDDDDDVDDGQPKK